MGLVAREHGIELARAVEGVQLVAAADMGFADENLRKGRARAGAIPHLLTKRRIGGAISRGKTATPVGTAEAAGGPAVRDRAVS